MALYDDDVHHTLLQAHNNACVYSKYTKGKQIDFLFKPNIIGENGGGERGKNLGMAGMDCTMKWIEYVGIQSAILPSVYLKFVLMEPLLQKFFDLDR